MALVTERQVVMNPEQNIPCIQLSHEVSISGGVCTCVEPRKTHQCSCDVRQEVPNTLPTLASSAIRTSRANLCCMTVYLLQM